MKKLHSPALEQKEAAKHGEAFFPLQQYITRLTADDPVVTTHWHEEAELTIITKGNCFYQIDLIDQEVKEGDIIFVPPCSFTRFRLAQVKNSFRRPMYFI